MSHFRLKRRVRRAVDSLSLMYAIYATPAVLLRGVLPHPAISGQRERIRSRPWWLRLSPSRRHRFLKARVHFGHRRFLTVMLATLAFALEVCGCDLVRDTGVHLESADNLQTVHAAAISEQPLSFNGAEAAARGLSWTPVIGGGQQPPVRPPVSQARPLPWAIPESVFFVYKSGEGSIVGPGRQPIATAFVLSVPGREHHHALRFLVTTRHVVDPQWAHCAETNPASIDLRLNRRSGGVAYENVALQSGQLRRFFTPADPTADLAVIPLDQSLIPNLNDYKFIEVPFRLIPTGPEALQFRADQPVMTARVPPWPSSDSGNYPVFDAGVLAEMPTEAVSVQCGAAQSQQPPSKAIHVWFIDAGVAEGASGSPVYTAIARGADGVKTPVLLGIQSIAWPDRGSAGITPSFVLGDLIESYLRQNGAGSSLSKGPRPRAKERAASIY